MPEERLDVRLARENEITRSRAETLIRQGQAQVNGCVETKPGCKVKESDSVSVIIPPPVAAEAQPEDLPLEILYEDGDLAVVVKPCGMVVHPAAGNEDGTLVNALLFHLKNLSGIGGALRPGIVHRLDKDTSGLLLVAKNDAAHLSLSEQIKNKTCHRIYLALLEGTVKQNDGIIDTFIGRSDKNRTMMAVKDSGRRAVTHFKVIKRYKEFTFAEFKLETGRTHQIRVHFSSIGSPLAGDDMYLSTDSSIKRAALHCGKLTLIHPVTNEEMTFTAPLPEDMNAVLNNHDSPFVPVKIKT